MTIEVEFTRSAERDILDASIAWRTLHSSAPGLLDDELNAALERIQLFPEIAPLTLLRRFKAPAEWCSRSPATFSSTGT